MDQEQAVVELEKMTEASQRVLEYFRPELGTLKRVRWDVQNEKAEIAKLKIEEKNIQANTERIRAEGEALKLKAQKEADKILELAHEKLRNARATEEESLRNLDEVKEFCNKFEAQRANELKKKVAA